MHCVNLGLCNCDAKQWPIRAKDAQRARGDIFRSRFRLITNSDHRLGCLITAHFILSVSALPALNRLGNRTQVVDLLCLFPAEERFMRSHRQDNDSTGISFYVEACYKSDDSGVPSELIRRQKMGMESLPFSLTVCR